jgi:hypothetical protein
MSILFDTTQRLIIVPAEVFGPLGSRSVHLALDTAATETVISQRVLAMPVSLPVDGLLGLDFIRGQRLVIDYRAGEITLT